MVSGVKISRKELQQVDKMFVIFGVRVDDALGRIG
jgi:hypothetical protein